MHGQRSAEERYWVRRVGMYNDERCDIVRKDMLQRHDLEKCRTTAKRLEAVEDHSDTRTRYLPLSCEAVAAK